MRSSRISFATHLRVLAAAVAFTLSCGACAGAATTQSRDSQRAASTCETTQPKTNNAALHFDDVAADRGITGLQWNAVDWPARGEDADLASLAQELPPELFAAMTAGASIVDIDSDGWDDVFLARLGLPNALYRNVCGQHFTDEAKQRGLALSGDHTGSTFADLNGDGHLDAVVLGQNDTPNVVLFNDGTGSFGPELTLGSTVRPNLSMHVLPVDIEADGDLDLFVSRWSPAIGLGPATSELLLNDGSGDFTLAEEFVFDQASAFMSSAADFNDDGRLDLALSADWGSSGLFLQDENGWFLDNTEVSNVGDEENGMGSVVADFDGDGRQDWFVTSVYSGAECNYAGFGCSGNRLYINRGDGLFREATDEFGLRDSGWGWGAAFGDFDNDGHPDLAAANGYETIWTYSEYGQDYEPFRPGAMRLWRNGGQTSWTESARSVGLGDEHLAKATIPFDFDRDGDLDLLVTQTGGHPLLYENSLGTQNSWLIIDVTHNDTPVLGATVRVETAAGGIQTQHTSTGNAYQGSTPPWVHFGLGDSESAVDITVSHPVLGTLHRAAVDPRQRITISFEADT